MLYTELTKKALKICFDAHKDKVDKCGIPYVPHRSRDRAGSGADTEVPEGDGASGRRGGKRLSSAGASPR